jgi:hypothetical protein
MKLKIQHNSELVIELNSSDMTRPELWDNLMNESVTYAIHLNAVEGGNTAIILENDIPTEKRASEL